MMLPKDDTFINLKKIVLQSTGDSQVTPTPLSLPGESHGQRSLEGCRVAKSWIHLKRLNAHARSKTLMTLLLCVIKLTKGTVIKNWNQQNPLTLQV